jgi:predicted nucleotidyltransferase
VEVGSRSAPIADQVERFIVLLSRDLDVERVVLFGSHAYGRPHEWSDIDLAVISASFADLGRVARLEWLERVAWEAQAHAVEPVGFTPQEYAEASDLSLVGEVRERGVVVYDVAQPERTPAMVLREQRAEYRHEEDP